MPKIKTQVSIILAVIFLSGCACYSFKKGESPYNNGFVASRYGRVLPEYTIGKDNSVPDEVVAKERFKRRRIEVEAYYKKMGYIKNRFRQMFIDPPFFMIQAVAGVFYMPSVAINDYKYNHDAAYKEKIDKQEDAAYKAEKERLRVLKEKLNSYIQNDLQKEAGVVTPVVALAPASEKIEPVALAPTAEPVKKESLPPEKPAQQASLRGTASEAKQDEAISKSEIASAPQPAASVEKQALRNDNQAINQKTTSPNAVIVAKPLKGVSPLTVQFYGSKSSSSNGKITSYLWDFGDGDTSAKKNPMNTYWSTTYGSRKFIATLTIKDAKGASADASTVIEVLSK